MIAINKRATGKDKEIFATTYLKNKGFIILETNYRVRQAEIDIIAKDGNTIVFVEVKYRKNDISGSPLEAVDMRKQRKISQGALFYLNNRKISTYDTPVRFDVIGIMGEEVTHIENAFDFIG